MRILFGITGSIAAIKTMDLIHKVVQLGHECKVIITKDGLNFVTPMALSSMGVDVFIDDNINQYKFSNIMEHINLAKWADNIIVVPASANTIAKLAHGFSDNLLTATILASPAKKIIVPAMNQQMWKTQSTQLNIEILDKFDYLIWGPTYGLQACGDVDVGRMIEVDDVVEKIKLLNIKNDRLKKLKDKKIVITAGGTIEPIDPVRYITNRSSGKMGYALAKVAVFYGAHVILISGRVEVEKPEGLAMFYSVDTAEEMLNVAKKEAVNADVFIGCAAVCDYKVKEVSTQKIKKDAEEFNLALVKNPDVIATIKKNFSNLYTVGFAAETQNLINYSINKLKSKNLDLIIANDITDNVFGSEYNQVTIIDKELKQFELEVLPKISVAEQIFDKIIKEAFKL
ncbi:MAG: bifunctional phosphopantothenoylcysteine decarboxylase/phosphopantothenate--cysteine ligase CoaBC [Neisseriaceae bacterium]|jgi:phosphopantothenoylcysteine decarboxylase/phosphopantothenate--cysteine ligase